MGDARGPNGQRGSRDLVVPPFDFDFLSTFAISIAGIAVATGKFASPRDISGRWTGLTVGDGSRDRPFIARAFYLPELIDFVNCNTWMLYLDCCIWTRNSRGRLPATSVAKCHSPTDRHWRPTRL
jgi:hypothetical protein